MNSVRVSPEATVELREAASWYKARSPDVAHRFLQNFRQIAKAVGTSPLRFPRLVEPDFDPPLRRALVPDFPYALVFLVNGRTVHVLAVAHLRREPGYWLQRVAPAVRS